MGGFHVLLQSMDSGKEHAPHLHVKADKLGILHRRQAQSDVGMPGNIKPHEKLSKVVVHLAMLSRRPLLNAGYKSGSPAFLCRSIPESLSPPCHRCSSSHRDGKLIGHLVIIPTLIYQCPFLRH